MGVTVYPLFQSNINHSNEISKLCHNLFPNNDKSLPLWFRTLYIPELHCFHACSICTWILLRILWCGDYWREVLIIGGPFVLVWMRKGLVLIRGRYLFEDWRLLQEKSLGLVLPLPRAHETSPQDRALIPVIIPLFKASKSVLFFDKTMSSSWLWLQIVLAVSTETPWVLTYFQIFSGLHHF